MNAFYPESCLWLRFIVNFLLPSWASGTETSSMQLFRASSHRLQFSSIDTGSSFISFSTSNHMQLEKNAWTIFVENVFVYSTGTKYSNNSCVFLLEQDVAVASFVRTLGNLTRFTRLAASKNRVSFRPLVGNSLESWAATPWNPVELGIATA